MSRSFPVPDEKQGFVGDNGEKSSGFDGERDVDPPVIEDIASEDGDCSDEEDGDDSVSDHESFVCGIPIVDPAKIRSENGVNRHPESSSSECPIAESTNLRPKVGVDALIRLDECDKYHKMIKVRFVSGLRVLGVNAEVVHIHRNLFDSSVITKARLQAFIAHSKAVKEKNDGDANIRHAWFGASKDDIKNIIMHGFNHDNIEKNGAFGCGLYLCSDQSPIGSVKSTTVDEEGMRHILFCRVILGKMEAIKPGSTQCYPSSDEFQTGVDNLVFPMKFMVWSTHVNSHVLPEFLITFKTLSGSNNGPQITKIQFDASLTPRMSIKALVSGVSKILPPDAVKKINEYHRSYIENKISRHDMLLGFRDLAGERLLVMVVKDFEEQAVKRLREMESKANQSSVG